jgi:UDPglucose--hexose-1-phosphate uridylyltransferase
MSELRRDPITGRLVICAPERSHSVPSTPPPQPVAAIDGDLCPFCEGHEAIAGRELLSWRVHGSAPNTPGWQVRVVPNREPALRVESRLGDSNDPLLQSFGGLGAHEVIIESPDHRASFATMSAEQISRVLWAWRERIRDLRRDGRLRSFLVVKNVGALAGATRDHPHSQLLALPLVPRHLEDEHVGARAHHARTMRCVYCDVITRELADATRVVASDADSIAFAPFASRVPFEVWVMPRAHHDAFDEASDSLLLGLGERLGDTIRRLNRALVSPPYSLSLHTAPAEDAPRAACHWHIEITPRLAAVSGLTWDGLHINPVPPEEAAAALRRGQP